MEICIPFAPSLATPATTVTATPPVHGTTMVDTEVLKNLTVELRNKTALIDKLETLLASSRHENDALRGQIVKQHDEEPEMDTVPLDALIEAVQTFLDDGQAIVIERYKVCVEALDNRFHCSPQEVNGVLDASDKLIRIQEQ